MRHNAWHNQVFLSDHRGCMVQHGLQGFCGPGQDTTMVQTRDNGSSGDNGNEDGERYKILEVT